MVLYHLQWCPRSLGHNTYDIVTTSTYIENEKHFALNSGKTKAWYAATYEHFQYWAERSGIPWRAIKPHLDETMEKARSLWPTAIKDLPMNDGHKQALLEHWGRLQSDFRIL